jgi:hypothetical protein
VGISLALDIVVAILLAVTIGYAVVLNRRLRSLREHKAELQKLADSFGNATARAEGSIGRLKTSADELRECIETAQALREDLAFLIERGGAAADRLEATVRSARKEMPAQPAQEAPSNPETKRADADDAAERELLKALRSAR